MERLRPAGKSEYAPIKGVLITGEEIEERVRELADEIYKDYEGEKLVFVGVLKGSSRFHSDLEAEFGKGNGETGRKPRDVIRGHLGRASYGAGTVSSGEVENTLELDTDIEGKNVIIVEDIIDTGHTLHEVVEQLREKNPKSLEVCVLLDKKERREVEVDVKYTGFVIPDEFVVGYGLDLDEMYRSLPYIGVIDQDKL